MLLEVSKLSKAFKVNGREKYAVNKVSLVLQSGMFSSIIGHSGSGKSTLFHLINGILRPTSGKILFNNECINNMGETKFALFRNQEIGFIPQEQNLLQNFTILENVCMPGLVSKAMKDRTKTYERAEILIEEIGLLSIENSFPNEVSGGEAKRASIARALINSPSILIADEPTGNLDPENSTIVMKMLRQISDNGVAVLISTHDRTYFDYCDHVYRMSNGSIQRHKGKARMEVEKC